MIEVDWKGGLSFEVRGDEGSFVMDAPSASGGAGAGVSPVEALLGSAAACSAMDVVAILEKKRQTFDRYRLRIDYARRTEGDWPRPVTAMTITHELTGENLDPDAVARAVELSDSKYCSVVATLRGAPKVTSRWRVNGAGEPPRSRE